MPCTLFSLLMLILFASISYYARSCGFEGEVDIMLCFAIVSHRMAVIDWSGEEYSGQVKRSITMMLKNYGIERFLWNTLITQHYYKLNFLST